MCKFKCNENCPHCEWYEPGGYYYESDWKVLDGKHYCPKCWHYDDNDHIVTADGKVWDKDTEKQIKQDALTREEEIEKGSAEVGAQYWHAGEINEYNFFKTRSPHDMFVCGAQWADAHPKNPYHKYPEEEPPCFGDYIVVVDDKNKGRRWALKCWYGHPEDPFGDNPSKEWLLNENETVSYWMEIPNIKKRKLI